MTPAQRRIATARKLDDARNAAALGAARTACLAPAVDRLASVLVGEWEFYVKGDTPPTAGPSGG